MTRRILLSVFALACLLALPTTATAQSAFAGVVKDTSGAVLPGVTVEAASEVLIEKVRSVTTDGNGAYRIENLRPGIYSITFSLPGFSNVKKDAIELPSNFVSTINADLKVGTVEETVTVSGESPVVDVQTNIKAQVLSREVLDAVPSAHTIQSVGQLVVGVNLTAPDVGGSQAMQQTYFSVHGLGAAQTSVLIDGMIMNGLQGDGAIQSYLNEGANQEMVYQTGGGTVDSPTGGVKINLIPKEGGNRFSGNLFEGYESSRNGFWQANNLTPRLDKLGVKLVDKIGTYNDTDVTQGGPIKKGQAVVLRIGPAVHGQQADRQHIPVRRHEGRHPRLPERARRQRWHAVPAGRGQPASVQLSRTTDVAGVAPQQAVRVLRSRTEGSRWSDGYRRRSDDVFRPVELAALHDQQHQVDLHGQQQAAHRRRVLREHRALQQPLSAGAREGVRVARVVCHGAAPGRRRGFAVGRARRAGSVSIRIASTRRASASYITGTHSVKVGFQDSWGPSTATRGRTATSIRTTRR
jgi:hypothetical protein